METEETQVKTSKKKFWVIPVVLITCMLGIALAVAVVPYFHQTQVDLTVNEARTSADLPIAVSIMSGETTNIDRVIHNNANVTLCAELSYTETSNPDGVIYTDNLPITVSLAPLSDTTVTAVFTADEITPAGAVSGNINYNKVACP